MTCYKKIFEPTYIGKLKIKNKTSMAPMGPIGYSDPFGGFNQRLQDYYVERAKYGVGLIITGICSVDLKIEEVDQCVLPCPTTMPFAFIHSTYTMNERIHAYGAKTFLQLTGGFGRSSFPGITKNNIAPTEQGNRFDPSIIHREMTKEEIENMVKQFIKSAVIAKEAGFDGVEIHAVHEGYLLDQFATAFYNKRNDEYGGSLDNRLKIAIDIVKGIKKACGKDYPVSLRYSLKSCMKGLRQGALPGEDYEEVGKDIDEGIEAAKILVNAGYDALNVDAGTYDSWYWNHPPMYFKEGVYTEFGEILKKNVDVPIILAGRMENPELAVKELGKSCDILSYGRQLLSDPEFVEKMRTGRLDEVRPCLGCHDGCLGRAEKGPISCAVNPSCGRENIYGIVPAVVKKRVLVVGGGPAGLEVARVATLAGHSVTLCEKSDKLGGNLIPGGAPDFKHYDYKLIDYYKRQLDLLQIDVRFNTTVTKENIDKFNADVVVLATGSTPRVIDFEGELKPVVAEDVLLKRVECGENVVVVGGGLVGCETALWLAQSGKKVTVLEMMPEILGGHGSMPFMNQSMLKDLLVFNNVDIYTKASIVNTKEGKVEVKQGDNTFEIPTDTLITSVGYISNNKLYQEVMDLNVPVFNIGDSNKVHNIMAAIWDAYEVARNL